MKIITGIVIFLYCFTAAALYSQPDKRGTIRIKRPVQLKYVISKTTSVALPNARVFRVRFMNYNFKEFFPKEYKSDLFPLMFNNSALILCDENKQWTDNLIVSYDYEIFKSQVQFTKGSAGPFSLTVPFRQLAYMMTGSSVWIKNLTYKDKNGVIHKNEIGEFKIEKVN